MASDASLKSQYDSLKVKRDKYKRVRDGIKIVILTINARPQKWTSISSIQKGL